MTTITSLPTPPSRNSPSTFSSRTDALLGALPTFVAETNAIAGEVNANAATATTQAGVATTQAGIAAAEAAAAVATAANVAAIAGAAAWVSGNTYAYPDTAISPATFQTYRKKTASSVTTTDPSADSANWEPVSTGGGGLLRDARTSNVKLSAAEFGRFIDITSGSFTQTIDSAATLGEGWFCYIRNSGTGDITLDPNGSETIDGLTSYIMYPGEVRLVQCDGTALRSVVLNSFYKVFTASGTFTKPPGYLFFQGSLFGGGGSGGASAGSNYSRGYASGGSGGARVDFVIKAEALAAQETFVAGAGGAAKTASTAAVSSIHNMAGSPGGSSSFKNISAPGGVAGGASESSVPLPVSNGGYKLAPLHPGINEGTAAGANTYSSSTYFSPAGGGAEPPYSAGGISFLAGSGGDSAVDLYSNNATPVIAVSGKFPGGGGGAAVKRTVNDIDMPSATSGAGASGGLIIFGVI